MSDNTKAPSSPKRGVGHPADNLPLAAILAGGASSRMGRPKALVELAGKPLLDHVVTRLEKQVNEVLVVGGPTEWASSLGLAHACDSIDGAKGPLAGILTAMEFANKSRSLSSHVFVTATDMPFLPPDLIAILLRHCVADEPVIPVSNQTPQPLAALWPMSLCDKIRNGLLDGSLTSLHGLFQQHEPIFVEFPTDPFDPFFNVNTAADLELAEGLVQICP